LRVLGCETVAVRHCVGGLPSARVMGGRLETLLADAGPRYWPWACGAYLLQARKQVPSMTALRLRWQRRPSLIRGSEMASDGRPQAVSPKASAACSSEPVRAPTTAGTPE
jgi:hypothetical protein